jgi:hypothetical protein
MALSFLYLMTLRLVGILLRRFQSEHAKDVEIAVLRTSSKCCAPGEATRVPPCRLPGRGMTAGFLNAAMERLVKAMVLPGRWHGFKPGESLRADRAVAGAFEGRVLAGMGWVNVG